MKVLLLTHRLPYIGNRGDRMRALHILKVLAARAEVHLASLAHSADEAGHAGDLETIAASVSVAQTSPIRSYSRAAVAAIAGTPLTHAMLDASGFAATCERLVARHRPDVVFAYCSGMARFALAPPLNTLPLVLDMVDVDSEKWRALSHRTRAPMRWIYAAEARRMAAFEQQAARVAQAVLVVNRREERAVHRLEPHARVRVVPIGVAIGDLKPPCPPTAEPRAVFCGVMNYPPNVEGALWLARTVWPLVRARRPDARLSIVGASPTPAVKALAEADPSIEVTGTVDDVRPYLWRSAIAVAPLFVARGVQTKVLEAVAAGLPAVVTSAVEDGLPHEILPACLVADTSQHFVSVMLDLFDRTPGDRRAIVDRADVRVLEWSRQLQPVVEIVEAAAARAHRPAVFDRAVAG